MSRLLTAAACACLLLAAGAPSYADPGGDSEGDDSGAEEAEADSFEALVAKGRKAYEAERWRDAAEAFERAYEKKQVANLLYNIGRAYEKAGDFERAVEVYEKFVQEPGISIDHRKDALDRIDTLEAIIEQRKQEEAEETGDEKKAKKNETDDEESGPGLAESDEGDEKGTVEPETKTVANYTPAIALLASGGVSLIGGTVFTILTVNAHESFESAESLSVRRQAAERGEIFSIVADSALGAGIVAAGFGLGYLIWPPTRTVETSASTRLRVAPVVSSTSAGLQLRIEF